MTVEVPVWVRIACQKWGRQKRRIWSGMGDWYFTRAGMKARHVDGYAQSFLARVQDERVGAGSPGEVRQHWEEVFWGEGLEVQRAVVGMPELPTDVIHLHYVFDPEFGLTGRDQAVLAGVSERCYWALVNVSETWVWARLLPESVRTLPEAAIYELPAVARPRKEAYKRSPNRMVDVSLEALHRPTLKLSR